MDDNRLDRIELKVDRLGEALAEIARIEERTASYNERMSGLESRISGVEKAVTHIAKQGNLEAGKSLITERLLFGIVVVGLVAFQFISQVVVDSNINP